MCTPWLVLQALRIGGAVVRVLAEQANRAPPRGSAQSSAPVRAERSELGISRVTAPLDTAGASLPTAFSLEQFASAIGASACPMRGLGEASPTELFEHLHAESFRPLQAQAPKAPLPYPTIERALPTYGESLPDLRAKALVTLQWSTMLRRAELVRLAVDDFEFSAEFDDALVRVRRSKADQKGHGTYRYISAAARAQVQRGSRPPAL